MASTAAPFVDAPNVLTVASEQGSALHDLWMTGTTRMAVPFPEEAVGAGAIWAVSTAVTFEGIDTT